MQSIRAQGSEFPNWLEKEEDRGLSEVGQIPEARTAVESSHNLKLGGDR